MKRKNANLLFVIVFCIICLDIELFSADNNGESKNVVVKSFDPIVPFDDKYHKIGTLWNRITNSGKMGDDSYSGRTPSCDWPGGSQNSYLYRGAIWLTARIGSQVHSTQTESNEFSPIDSVRLFNPGFLADAETYTKYYDVKAPSASNHFPLGLEVSERTYAWSNSSRDDFILYEFQIKNVGIDTNGDGYPDTDRDLHEFYFTISLDGDISKQPYWPADYRYVNEDDHAISNASWDWINYFPNWASVNHNLTPEKADSSMIIFWDGDNPNYPAWAGGPSDDTGNPSLTGTLQSPGFLGFKVIKTEPESFQVSSYHTTDIYNLHGNDQEAYTRYMSQYSFDSLIVNNVTGNAIVNDYRGYLTIGPLDTFFTDQTIAVIGALGVGCNPDSGGIYSLMELVSIMETAEYWTTYYGLPNEVKDVTTKLPGSLELMQNYPNPFNPTTKIKYTLPKSEKVKIVIFNSLGQKLKTLLNEQLNAGSHEIEFTANNLPSGIYLYRIQAGDYQEVKKMILLK
jgi:type IX secretion system substrate protein